jgi:hypothetical protein
MYIATRTRAINQGKVRAAVAAAVEAGSRASAISGQEIFVWSSIFSSDGPAVSWSVRVEHLADVVALDDALISDEGFAKWIEDNDGLFAGPSSDVVSQVVHGAPSGPPKTYVQATRAVCANGSIGEGMGIGVEIADAATRITGIPVLFLAAVSGTYGSVAWLSSVDDLAEMEAANAALVTDDDWVKLIDRAGHAFAPGTSAVILRRLA